MEADLESPGSRLRWARAKAGYKDAAEFARAVGQNIVSYRAYENDQNGYFKHAKDFARKLGVSVEFLLYGGNARIDAIPAPRPDFPVTLAADSGETVEIIQLDLSLPMGPGATVDEYIEEQALTFDLAYVRAFTRTPTDRLRIARGVGDSMFPTLNSADQVWIDSTQTVLNQSDRIWAVSINGAAAIKRLRPLKGGRVLVISDNPTIDNYEVEADEVRIGGRVIRFARDV